MLIRRFWQTYQQHSFLATHRYPFFASLQLLLVTRPIQNVSQSILSVYYVRLHSSTVQVRPRPLRRSSLVYQISRKPQEMPTECHSSVSLNTLECIHYILTIGREYRLDENCGSLLSHTSHTTISILTNLKATVKRNETSSAFSYGHNCFIARRTRRTAAQYPFQLLFGLLYSRMHHEYHFQNIRS